MTSYKKDKAWNRARTKEVIRHLSKTNEVIPGTKEDEKKFIDFWVETAKGKIPIKFKAVREAYPNILLERMHGRNSGWFIKSEAEYFLYFMNASKTLYSINIEEVRQFVNDNPDKAKKSSMGSDNGLYHLVAIRDLNADRIIFKTEFI